MWVDRTQPGKSGNGVWSACGKVTKHRVVLNTCNKFEGIYIAFKPVLCNYKFVYNIL